LRKSWNAPGTKWRPSLAAKEDANALAAATHFLVREATAARPLIPLRVFRSRNLAGGNLLQALLVAGMFGMFFLGALYLQRVLHYSALGIGLAFLPTTLVMGTMSLRYSERLVMRFGARRVLIVGMSLAALGLAVGTSAFKPNTRASSGVSAAAARGQLRPGRSRRGSR